VLQIDKRFCILLFAYDIHTYVYIYRYIYIHTYIYDILYTFYIFQIFSRKGKKGKKDDKKQRKTYLDVDQILDLLIEGKRADADKMYINPPEGDISDGYDMSDHEEGKPDNLKRSILKVCIFCHKKFPNFNFF
jgi:hypothetical protein